MVYKLAKTREEGLAQVTGLVATFEKGRKSFMSTDYKETPLRSDFLDILLMSFGWDVKNENAKTQFLRDVVLEESIDVEDELNKKCPDYTLRVQGLRKLFIEAKKPSVSITKSTRAAFQTRRYGWNANLGISILSNFDKLVVYDCRYKPNPEEDERIARYRVFDSSEYISAFDELYDLISYESATSGKLDDHFSVADPVGQTFDDYFLAQIEDWRKKLAHSAVQRNKNLTGEDINFLIQRLLNRIVFLRICEDRSIEKFETLKNIKDYNQLKSLFLRSDRKYNSGLFDFIEDSLSLCIELDSELLIEIFNELYYPLSPYNFSVVDPSILSQIYEKFLGSRVVLEKESQLTILQEPEVVASNGVVPTPKLIVERIVKETLNPLVEGKTSSELSMLKIADICCGSGTFLISVYDFLLQTQIEQFQKEQVDDSELIFQLADGTLGLTFKAKRGVLEQNIYGVDINPYAVEVTKFSLLLKLLEGESAASIDYFINEYDNKVLPDLSDAIKCGNSLVDEKFYEFNPETFENDDLLFKIRPFQWEKEFRFLFESGGFDAILGNPPYVRIQNLVKYAPEEIKYYQSEIAGYAVARKDTIDKYYVFIQRAIELLRSTGYLGYIVPHKFFINKSGHELRSFISEHTGLLRIIHFGVAQVFPDRSTYTAILIIQKTERNHFSFKRVRKITPELLASSEGYSQYNTEDFAADPWVFLSPETGAIFKKLRSGDKAILQSITNILVGLQTSLDKVYIIEPESETERTFCFSKSNIRWEIEKNICKPCAYDLSFNLFDTISPNAQIIFPYSIIDGKAEVFSEEYLEGQFPLTWIYLSAHKKKLEKRDLTGKNPKWYQFGRSQNLTRFHDSQKLIWPVLSTKASYVLDEGNIQFTGGGNGPYYALLNNSDYSLYYLLGILSHPLFECMVKAGASEFRGDYYSHGKQFIENLPIKEIDLTDVEEVKLYDAIVKVVKNLITTKQKYGSAYGTAKKVFCRKMEILQNIMVTNINKLYGITEDEFNTVINDEMFTHELNVEEN